jgi:alkanesulfonate monooxygenase
MPQHCKTGMYPPLPPGGHGLKPLRFHWSLSSAGEPAPGTLRGAEARASQSGVPDLGTLVRFCRRAERSGIDSLLMAFGFHRMDPVALSAALGHATREISFLVAVRSGVMAPTYCVQQINSLAALTGGRVAVNVVAGHSPHEHGYYGDFLDHDRRYERTAEFWTVCRALWEGEAPVDFAGRHYRVAGARLRTPYVAAPGPARRRPEIYVGGGSPQAVALARDHADCLLRLPDAPEAMAAEVAELTAAGVEVGLLVSLIVRPRREQALAAAGRLVAAAGEAARGVHRDFARRADSVSFRAAYARAADGDGWRTRTLWSGAVPYLGAPAVALVGSTEEIVETLFDYRRIGVSQFLFMGWPDLAEMTFFGRQVLPRVRARERREAGPPPGDAPAVH